jgi:hypothetical protein
MSNETTHVILNVKALTDGEWGYNIVAEEYLTSLEEAEDWLKILNTNKKNDETYKICPIEVWSTIVGEKFN